MKAIYLAGAAVVLVACSGGSDSGSGDTEAMRTAENVSGDEMSGEEMSDGEIVESRPIDGRWGIQYEACSEDNVSGDGLIQISRYDVIIGFEGCSIAGVRETDGVYEIDGQCDGMEGPYERTLYFSSPQESVLRWDNRELNRVEDYIACDGGASH